MKRRDHQEPRLRARCLPLVHAEQQSRGIREDAVIRKRLQVVTPLATNTPENVPDGRREKQSIIVIARVRWFRAHQKLEGV